MVPVIDVDGRAFGGGAAGERTLMLQQTLLAIARRHDVRHGEWMTHVPAGGLSSS